MAYLGMAAPHTYEKPHCAVPATRAGARTRNLLYVPGKDQHVLSWPCFLV